MGTSRPPITPEQVRLYFEPPTRFEVFGVISASSDAGLTEQASMNYAIEKLKKQASKIGGNGVSITATSNAEIDVFGERAKTVQGKAVFVVGQ